MDEEQRNVEVIHLVNDIFEVAGALKDTGHAIARQAGQTHSRWQVMWTAAPGHFSVPMIARRNGRTRQSVQRIADELVEEGLATFEPNPDHQRSPLVVLTPAGEDILRTMNQLGSEQNLRAAAALGDDGVARFRALLDDYRRLLAEPVPTRAPGRASAQAA